MATSLSYIACIEIWHKTGREGLDSPNPESQYSFMTSAKVYCKKCTTFYTPWVSFLVRYIHANTFPGSFMAVTKPKGYAPICTLVTLQPTLVSYPHFFK